MSAPKFIRFRKQILSINGVKYIWLDGENTKMSYETGSAFNFDGDVRDELWDLIKFALAPKDESYPSDTTHLQQRIMGVEKKVTLIVDHIEADHVSRIKAAGHRKPASMEDIA